MIVYASLLACLVGLVLHLIGGRTASLGLVMFGCGLLVFLASVGGHSVRIV